MPSFGKTSKMRLDTCEKELQLLFNKVIKYYDCIIIQGHRSIEEQQRLFKEGKSKIDGISRKGNHNYYPSRAVDVAPYFSKTPHVRWNDSNSFYHFAGFVRGVAQLLHDTGTMQYRLRYGGDWNQNMNIHDQTFNDLVHFELVIK